ncbi:hypothetical protein AnaeK_3431 [Anaeromyxobacter sp. K]|uniref:hypothetical protein n=1 Tax=Anaeromyxobacter sp. (strain K) TaxID=447217 RepID=UPI00015F9AB1|nr:hypothetical protein [Anaeromyxobacter sp. K]ACG74644.1 hypothetical protein AnaeK_3431 [Anaeromyxobacter sp. K]
MHPEELLERGVERLRPFFDGLGFRYAFLETVEGSGGVAARGEFRRGRCFVGLHVRGALGIVEYGLDGTPYVPVRHRDVVARLGVEREAMFPGFGDDPLTNFDLLLSDLERFVRPLLADEETLRALLATPTPERSGHLP